MSRLVISYVRMNPPTIGHKVLVDRVLEEACGGDSIIYVSRTHDIEFNPLDINTKMYFIRKMFPHVNFHAATSDYPHIGKILQELSGVYDEITIVAGSDRVATFQKMMENSNDRIFRFKNWKVITAGEERNSGGYLSSISSSKIRELVKEANFESFSNAYENILSDNDISFLYKNLEFSLINTDDGGLYDQEKEETKTA